MKLYKIKFWHIILLGMALTLLVEYSKHIDDNRACKNKYPIHQQK